MILLVNPPTLWEVGDLGMLGQVSCFELQTQHVPPESLKSFPAEHLGLAALAAACRRRGQSARIINAQVLLHRSIDQTRQAIVDAARDEPPTVVGFSGPSQVFLENVELARFVKDRWPDAVTTLGADFATLNARRILTDYDVFDAVIEGEAEAAFPELVEAVAAARPFTETPRVVTRDTLDVPRRLPPLLNLDELPWVARDDTRAVLTLGMSAGVYGSRGCPYRCTFCTTGQVTARNGPDGYREKSVENLVEEIDFLRKDFDIDYVTISDDLFVTKSSSSQERARRFGQAYAARGLSSIPFMIDCRVDSMEFETLSVLRKAGLHRIFVGVETTSSQTLQLYDKTYGASTLPDYISSRLRIAVDLGIDVVPGIITYHPAVTVAELRRTLNVIDAIGYRGSFQFLNKVVAHPGTPLWNGYVSQRLLDPEWPVAAWTFQDPEAKAVSEAAFAAAARGADFDGIRSSLLAAITHYEEQHAGSVEA